MTVLNECVWFCVKWISWTVGLHRAVNMAALNLKMAAPPAVALVQSLVKIKRKNNRYLRKIAMLFGAAPSAKNTDFTARLRHLPSLFFFLRHLLSQRCNDQVAVFFSKICRDVEVLRLWCVGASFRSVRAGPFEVQLLKQWHILHVNRCQHLTQFTLSYGRKWKKICANLGSYCWTLRAGVKTDTKRRSDLQLDSVQGPKWARGSLPKAMLTLCYTLEGMSEILPRVWIRLAGSPNMGILHLHSWGHMRD